MTVVIGYEMYKVKMHSGASLFRLSYGATGVYMVSICSYLTRKVVVIR